MEVVGFICSNLIFLFLVLSSHIPYRLLLDLDFSNHFTIFKKTINNNLYYIINSLIL